MGDFRIRVNSNISISHGCKPYVYYFVYTDNKIFLFDDRNIQHAAAFCATKHLD